MKFAASREDAANSAIFAIMMTEVRCITLQLRIAGECLDAVVFDAGYSVQPNGTARRGAFVGFELSCDANAHTASAYS